MRLPIGLLILALGRTVYSHNT